MERQSDPVPSPESNGTVCYAVRVLGPFGVLRDGEPLDPGTWPRRSQTLLKLLVTAHQGRRLRDEVVDLLWPESEPEAGASNLRYVLHALRRELGGGDPPPIASDREWISLSSRYDWEVDLQRFQKMAGEADGSLEVLEEAMALCRGEPLAEDRYEDWALPVREQVEQTWRTVGLRLSGAYRNRGMHEESLRWAERLLARDPLDEEAMQELLEALEAAGRRAQAVRRYREFERRLADELGVTPSDETRALLARLTGPAGAAAPDPATPPEDSPRATSPTGRFLGALPPGPIVARQDELERVSATAASVLPGNGRFIVLVGEPGVGKTRLAQEAMVRLRDRGFLVLTGRCSSRSGAAPFHPLAEACAQTGMPVWAAEKDLSSLPGRGEEARPSNGMEQPSSYSASYLAREASDVLIELAERQPVGLLIDDLHWADVATLDVLQYLAGSTRAHRVLLLATYREPGLAREHPLLQTIRELDREDLVERLTVRRLTEEGTAAMVELTVGELDAGDDFVEFVYRRTKGNPFYIDKMLRALGGRYRLLRLIGAGGMGCVFEAVDTQTGVVVAAKIMFARTEADPKALQRFEQEGAVLATLTHPNIVGVRGVFIEERASCIVMELLHGRALGQVLRDESLSLGRVKRLAHQVAAALVCAHEHGIVHRDIKPDNIMVIEDDEVKVTDFGIARLLRPADAVTTMTSTGMTMGTPLYMAPEQIEGKMVDGRTDVYALGCVLYEMVTGRPPFEGEDPLMVAIKHVREAPRPPRELNSRLPKDWEKLILKALAKDPSDRFPSATAMEKALDAVSDGVEHPRGHTPSLGIGNSRPIRVAAGIAALSVALGIVAYRTVSTSHASPMSRLLGSWILPPASSTPFTRPAAIASGAQGTFYVLDQGSNRVVRVSSTGTRLEAWGGLGSNRGQLRNPQALAVDRASNVYVADTGNDRVEKFSPTGQLLAAWGGTGSALGQFREPDGIAVDERGFIFVADSGNNRVEVLDPSGRPQVTSVASFTALYAGLNRPAGIAVNSRNEAYIADNGDNGIIHYSPDGVTVFGSWAAAGDPTGVALDTHGRLYVTDPGKAEVQLFSSSGKLLRTWEAGEGPFKSPEGVTIDAHGVVYLADAGNGRILKLSRSGRWLPAWNRSGPAPAASPEALALDKHGDLYVADTANSRVVIMSPSGRWLGTRKVSGSFVGPIGGITLDKHGDLLVTDYGGNDVLRFSDSGRVLARWGSNPSGPGLTNPQGIAVDQDGNIYVADQGNTRIQEYFPNGTLRAVWSVPASNTTGSYLYGITVDRRGYVYVTDELGARVLTLARSGRMVSEWGASGSRAGQLRAPEGIAADNRSGRIYVADTDNRRIQIFSSGGKVLDASSTRFIRPVAVVVDGQGSVYVADAGSRRIDKFSP